ncbi:hypothetical protein WT19_03230 [Burkholderia stagnalis]|nr:hypothetical protein WT17_03080 [Burkholderia stagnalis]KVO80081.1 hypothetical protein WT19_03230 [Burkholderia stagnalis]KVW66459.1 hypothetical protein WT28_06675 [Burkholderia stagnalis]KVX78212.1 hypothetical protein WT34_11575 [Burkholderia stagnalis]
MFFIKADARQVRLQVRRREGIREFPGMADQRAGLRCRRHAAGCSGEERIVRVFPQVAEPGADRRLAPAQLLG